MPTFMLFFFSVMVVMFDFVVRFVGFVFFTLVIVVFAFMVVVFGGVGNLWGTLVGAFTLGIANKFLEPVAGAVLGKIAILVLIILFIQKRPRGLFALQGRAVEA